MTAAGSLSDRVCLITGATNGIGFETARGLAQLGAKVIIVGRDRTRTETAAAQIRSDTGNSCIECLVADLSSQREVKSLVEQLRLRYPQLHILINNAGVFVSRCTLTVDGIEMQWAVNHLAYYMIAESLADLLCTSAPARVINVASDAHYHGDIHFDDIAGARDYAFGERAYNQSKLANVLFTYDLARRLNGTGVTVNCLHPGVIRTGIGLNNKDLVGGFLRIRNLFLRGAREGARASIYLASSPDVASVSGEYFAECAPKKSSARSHDVWLQQRLREISADMTGVPPFRCPKQGSAAAQP